MTDEELPSKDGASPRKATHRERLERELLAAFDARMARAHVPRRPVWLRLAPAAVLLLCLGFATQVPAAYLVEVGKRITLKLPSGSMPPRLLPHEVVEVLKVGEGKVLDVNVQLRKEAGGAAVLVMEVWGDGLVENARVAERVRALPALAGAEVTVEGVQGRVHDTVLGALRHALLRKGASPEERERARQRVIEELRQREGPDAQVDVTVEEDSRGVKTQVKVRKERQAPESP